MRYVITDCEQCGEPLSIGDPGNWWVVTTNRYTVTVPLHEETCRSEWFMKQGRIYSFLKDKRIEDVI